MSAIGPLSRAYAFEVAPKQERNFLGGSVDGLEELSAGLAGAAELANLDRAPHFNLRVDQNRSSTTRDAFVTLSSISTVSELKSSSELMASKLGRCMDNRSRPCLLVVSIHDSPVAVATWMFPREDVIQRTGDRISIREAFSLSSYLRKAALFERGTPGRSSFLSGRVIDKQSSTGSSSAAQFWTDSFIEADAQLTAVRGTQLVVDVFRKANDELGSNADQRHALHTAVGMTRSRGAHVFDMHSFTQSDLPQGDARDSVLRLAREKGLDQARFDIDPSVFENQVRFKIYDLSNGVRVTVPFADSTAYGVNIDGNRLTVSGEIETSRIRGRG